MKILCCLPLFLFVYMPCSLYGQKVISSKTKPAQFKMVPEFERTLPPNLYIDMEFIDENKNGILEAEEKAKLNLSIINYGKGSAQGVTVKISNQSKTVGLKLGKEVEIREIKPNDTKIISIPIEAEWNVKTGENKIQISVKEHFGFDVDPAYLVLTTLEYQKPNLVFLGFEIDDSSEETASIVNDGKLQAGEQVRIKLIVQNTGNNIARDVSYSLVSKDVNIFIDNGSGIIGDVKIGEVKEFWVKITPNKRLISKDTLPVFLTVIERNKPNYLGVGINNFQLPISLNQRPALANVLTVKADVSKLRKQIARFEYNSEKYTAKISVNNIDVLPVTKTKRKKAVAIVIGIENYDNLPPAPYAVRDAEIMTRYFKEVLGVNEVITHFGKEVSGFFFDQIFDTRFGKLAKIIEKDETEVFVYYSGHGLPSKDGKNVYLLPTDGSVESLETHGYSLNKLYKNLDSLHAKSVTVILDACFSGSSRVSSLYTPENISNTKGVVVRPRINQPWITNPNFTVLASSKDDQTSLGFDASETGLFTYYIAVGLQGMADLNGDKKITMKELFSFLSDKVVDTSKKIRGEQTPQLYGTDDEILVEF